MNVGIHEGSGINRCCGSSNRQPSCCVHDLVITSICVDARPMAAGAVQVETRLANIEARLSALEQDQRQLLQGQQQLLQGQQQILAQLQNLQAAVAAAQPLLHIAEQLLGRPTGMRGSCIANSQNV